MSSVRINQLQEFLKSDHWLQRYCILSGGVLYFEPPRISVKFYPFVASLYLQMLTNYGRFIFICNKMALIFLSVLIVFTVSSFEFQQVRLL